MKTPNPASLVNLPTFFPNSMDYFSRGCGILALQTKKEGEKKVKRGIFRSAVSAALIFAMTLPAAAAKMLIPVGEVVGLSLAEGTVTVVAFDDALGAEAKDAGLQIGDEIESVDGRQIDSAQDLHQALVHSDGSVRVTVIRDRQRRELKLMPVVSDQGPKLGVYIREGITGIGTITYYDSQSGCFGALGHGVSDSRGKLAGMITGSIYDASVVSVKPGKAGAPGQLKGAVSAAEPIGQLYRNSGCGIFGNGCSFGGEAVPVAAADQVKPGQAQILSNVSGDTVEAFQVEILKVYDTERENGRNMLLRVTDEKLLQTTGGIVAGMSGSPIIQNGYLVGAVTHVLVNDPTTGYGILIENMLDAAG